MAVDIWKCFGYLQEGVLKEEPGKSSKNRCVLPARLPACMSLIIYKACRASINVSSRLQNKNADTRERAPFINRCGS